MHGSSESNPVKVDRLSQLPNEILQTIFDQSLDHTAATLSKRLAPLVDKVCYRQVELCRLRSVSLLVATLRARPSLASLIRKLVLSHPTWSEGRPGALPNAHKQLALLLSLLPSLLAAFGEDVHLDVLRIVSSFPHVEQLQIMNWDACPDPGLPVELRFPSVVSLSISGFRASDAITSTLIDACPSLNHLTLILEEPGIELEGADCFDNILNAIPQSFTSLTSLHLVTVG
ncbi:hypothetical protein JCM11491_001310 [Sporobolomyces phaffii]